MRMRDSNGFEQIVSDPDWIKGFLMRGWVPVIEQPPQKPVIEDNAAEVKLVRKVGRPRK